MFCLAAGTKGKSSILLLLVLLVEKEQLASTRSAAIATLETITDLLMLLMPPCFE